jgi:co-chaperonin GroES (HSP10)
MALPSDWLRKCFPVPGQLLVRRVRQGYIWEGIIQIPDSYIGFTKNANAQVVAVGFDVEMHLPELKLGDIVWVAQGVTRKIAFEDDHDEVFEPALYACYPGEIIMNLGQLEKPEPVALEEDKRGRYHTESSLDRAKHDRRADEIG